MSIVGKSSAVLVCACMLTPAAFAQNKTVIIKYLNPKQDVRKTLQNMTRVPSKYARVNALDEVRRTNFQHAVLDGFDMALERQAVQAAQAKRSALPKADLNGIYAPLSVQQRKSWVAQKIKPVKDYLAAHQNNWPEYNKFPQSNQLLRYIADVMEMKNPSPQVRGLQRELIRLRATSNARTPYEVSQIVGAMMEYDIVPVRATRSAQENGHTDEEITLGEDLAFAMAASKVAMKDNPWKKISGFERMTDVINTYNAMRRQDPVGLGIPETYMNDNLIHAANIPLLTKADYLEKQYAFAVNHPFEFVLAPFWEQALGDSLYTAFNNLSQLEKEAILLNAPKLPRSVNVDSKLFMTWYDNAVILWEEANRREVRSYAEEEDTEALVAFLNATDGGKKEFLFQTDSGRVPFIRLSPAQQVEVLMWAWKHWHLLPSQGLKKFKA